MIIRYTCLKIMVVTRNAGNCFLVFRDKQCTYKIIVFLVCLTIFAMVTSECVFFLFLT